MSRVRLRQIILFLGLAVTVSAVLWARNQQEAEENSVATAVIQTSATPVTREESQRLALDRLNRRKQEVTDIDPLRTKSWYVPLPEAAPAPPPKPTAPPLPFQYAGKLDDVDGGNMMVYLSKGSESFAIKLGEKFDGVYQFEGIDKGNVVILYLPLSVKQRLSIGQIE